MQKWPRRLPAHDLCSLSRLLPRVLSLYDVSFSGHGKISLPDSRLGQEAGAQPVTQEMHSLSRLCCFPLWSHVRQVAVNAGGLKGAVNLAQQRQKLLPFRLGKGGKGLNNAGFVRRPHLVEDRPALVG